MTRPTCVAALRDEAETWGRSPAIRQALRALADELEARGPQVAMATASEALDAATTPAQVEAYQTALAMLYECEDDE